VDRGGKRNGAGHSVEPSLLPRNLQFHHSAGGPTKQYGPETGPARKDCSLNPREKTSAFFQTVVSGIRTCFTTSHTSSTSGAEGGGFAGGVRYARAFSGCQLL